METPDLSTPHSEHSNVGGEPVGSIDIFSPGSETPRRPSPREDNGSKHVPGDVHIANALVCSF